MTLQEFVQRKRTKSEDFGRAICHIGERENNLRNIYKDQES